MKINASKCLPIQGFAVKDVFTTEKLLHYHIDHKFTCKIHLKTLCKKLAKNLMHQPEQILTEDKNKIAYWWKQLWYHNLPIDHMYGCATFGNWIIM